MGSLKKIELRHFSDASTEGYGQCSYLGLVDTSEQVHCSLVMGNSRVTPLKPITIPRLELSAAPVSVRVSDMLGRELKYNELEEVFWTEGKVVQAYIQNYARHFHTFVANRVQQIREHTAPEQWHYVDGKSNPADVASRGLGPKDLLQSSRWFRRPPFLWDHRVSWKDFDKSEPEPLQQDDKEVKKASSLATSVTNKEQPVTLLQRLEYFSSWSRAKHAVAVCWRYRKILLERARERKITTEGVKTRSAAFQYHSVNVKELIKRSRTRNQKTRAERSLQATKGEAKGVGPFYRLNPFLDQNNLVRID